MILNKAQQTELRSLFSETVRSWSSIKQLQDTTDKLNQKYELAATEGFDLTDESLTADVESVNELVASIKAEADTLVPVELDLAVFKAIEEAPAEESSEEESSE